MQLKQIKGANCIFKWMQDSYSPSSRYTKNYVTKHYIQCDIFQVYMMKDNETLYVTSCRIFFFHYPLRNPLLLVLVLLLSLQHLFPSILSSLLHLWRCLCWLLRGSVRCRRGLIKETEREIWPAALFSAREPGSGGAVSDPGATTSFL